MRRARAGPDVFEFRPRVGIAACVVWAVVAGLWLLAQARTGLVAVAATLPLICLVSIVVYALFGRPRVIVTGSAVVLRNVLREVQIPFEALAGIDTQYALTLTTVDGRRFQAWAAPAAGRMGADRVTEEERKALTWSGPVDEIPSSAGLRSDAGAAAVVIRRRWQPPAAAGTVDGGSAARLGGAVQIRWATWLLVAMAVCLVGTVLVGIR